MRLVIPLFGMVQAEIDKITKVVRENLTGIRVIRAFNRIDHEKAVLTKPTQMSPIPTSV